ncbi:MAG: thiamine diphosphokinase [Alphaproteobacteria bacterium]|nr:thiamine diphosphokinase [Alphaproteobacteria bacterium]
MQEPSARQAKRVISCPGVLALVGGGDVDPGLLRQLSDDGAMVIAADGGAKWCTAAGIVPRAIIGDMDSLENRSRWADKTELIELDEQETTDFEKCLYSTSAALTVALGMVGGRLDHTLSAFHVVARYGFERSIIVAGSKDVALGVAGKFCLDVPPGAPVSVMPLVPVSFVRSAGLEFALDGLELAPGVRTGVSNRATGGRILIEPATDGVYLVIVASSFLRPLMDAGLRGTG